MTIWGFKHPSEWPRGTQLSVPLVEASILCWFGMMKTWLITLGRKETVRRQRCEEMLDFFKKVMGSEVAVREGMSELSGNRSVICSGNGETTSGNSVGRNPERLLMRPKWSLFHWGWRGWLSHFTVGQYDIWGTKGGRRSTSNVGWTERGNFECVHVYVGSGTWSKQGKWESGNEPLLSPYYRLDSFYMLSMKFFQWFHD